MDADLNIQPETPKLLEENTGGQLLDRGLGSFGGHDTRSTGNKSKNKQAGLPQTHGSFTAKETITDLKGSPRNGRACLQTTRLLRR